MSDETVQLGGFGSLVKKIQENNKQVSEEDLSSLFSQTLENSESGAISAADFSNTLSETYGLENNAELLETICQIAQNDGDEDGLTIEDFKIQKEYDDYSKQIFDATVGKLTTDEDSFNEVLNNENLTGEDWANIIQSYENLYGRNLINDIVEDFSGITESALRNQIMEKIASKLTESIENGSELALEVACEQLSRSISVSHVNKKATDFIINLLGSSDRTNALILNKYAEITGSDLIADIDFNPNIQKADKDLIKYRLETAKLFDLDGSSNQLSAYEELDLNNYSLEDQNKAWVINLLAQNLNGSLLDFQNQNNEDGIVSGGFNLIKSLTGIGVSSGDITSCLTQQRELIKELTLALNGKSEKYLSFEEAYKDLTGVEYNEDKIIEYKENENNYIIACEAMQRAQTFQNSIAEAETLQNAYDLFVEYFGDEQIGKEEFLSYIRSGMMPDPDNDDDINDKLVTFGYVKDVYFDENGQLVVTKITNYGKKRSPDEEDKIEVLVHDLSSTSNMIRTLPRTFDNTKYTSTVENTIKECFGGSIEDLQKRYSDSKKEALGTADKLEETVNKYCQSQDGFIDKLCGITQMVGIGTMAVGGVVSFVNIPLGSGIMTAGKYMALSGMFGDNVLGTVDGLTSADGLSKEEVAELVKETA
ncbi:MAG: hypothetical protein IJW73_02375, partial [Candidatus Gastranaerophilales bacterium]|nr:hypothetical protein [Candidatus Gastranaerophilales bacterium]